MANLSNFDAAKAMFVQADKNKDGRIDAGEFRSWAANGTAGGVGSSQSAFESASFQSYGAGAGAGASTGLVIGTGAAASAADFGTTSGYEVAYASQSGFESAGAVDGSFVGVSSSTSTNEVAEAGAVQQTAQYVTSSGIYKDPNPQIIRRAAVGGAVTYKQNISVRFLQPPPVPPHGPLIIKEVRPPQPPPPPPLVVRQRAPPLPQPPPLVLRERPPVAPASIAAQTVIRRLPAIPVPPRSVIIERLPPLPPRPRDIIIERWVPYAAQAKRRTIIQRAAAVKPYPQPRNIIIVYEPVQARIVRQFQRLGVVQENPQAYLARWGTALLDGVTLVQQARAAGVIEDITAPGFAVASSQFVGSFGAANAGFNAYDAAAAQASSFSTSEAVGLEGLEVIGGAEAGTYGLKVADGAAGSGFSSQSYSSSTSYGNEGAFVGGAGFDLAAASFASADTNNNGTLDQAEFSRFFQGGI